MEQLFAGLSRLINANPESTALATGLWWHEQQILTLLQQNQTIPMLWPPYQRSNPACSTIISIGTEASMIWPQLSNREPGNPLKMEIKLMGEIDLCKGLCHSVLGFRFSLEKQPKQWMLSEQSELPECASWCLQGPMCSQDFWHFHFLAMIRSGSEKALSMGFRILPRIPLVFSSRKGLWWRQGSCFL